MSKRWTFFLVAMALVFACGLVISFKQFQINNNIRLSLQEQNAIDVGFWVNELLIHKVQSLESGVAQLDKSTTEGLKRSGVDYFAYAYRVGEQWKVKWKIISEIPKTEVEKQVQLLQFGNYSSSKRIWLPSANNNLILISPVQNAKSEQFKEGFLVFHLNHNFYGSLSPVKSEVRLVSFDGDQHRALFPQALQGSLDSKLFDRAQPKHSQITKVDGISTIAVSVFYPDLQLWILSQRPILSSGFFTSSAFITLVLAMLLLALVGFLVLRRLPEVFAHQPFPAGASADSVMPLVLQRLRNDLEKLRMQIVQKSEPLIKNEIVEHIDRVKNWLGKNTKAEETEIRGLGARLEALLDLHRDELALNNISLHTKIEDDVSLCAPLNALEEIMVRLLENSIRILPTQADRRISVELGKNGSFYNLIYQDSRKNYFPQLGSDIQLLAATDPLRDISGIMAFGQLCLGERLVFSETELYVCIHLAPAEDRKPITVSATPAPIPGAVYHIEEDINEEGILEQLQPIRTLGDSAGEEEFAEDFAPLNVPSVADRTDRSANSYTPRHSPLVDDQEINQMVNDFELRSLKFVDEDLTLHPAPDLPADPTVAFRENLAAAESEAQIGLTESANGMTEFHAGKMSLKIRAPKKRQPDVNS